MGGVGLGKRFRNTLSAIVLSAFSALQLGCPMPGTEPQLPKPKEEYLVNVNPQSIPEFYQDIIDQYKSGNTAYYQPEGRNHKGEPTTIAWDASGWKKYVLFYRPRFSSDWIFLKDTYTTEYNISQLGSGIYEIGVIAIGKDEDETDMHTSHDSAQERLPSPSNGWYLILNKYLDADSNKDSYIFDQEIMDYIDQWDQEGNITLSDLEVAIDAYISQ